MHARDAIGPVRAPGPSTACRVWWARVAALRPVHASLLDEVERGRRDAYRRHEDRDRFTLGAALVRLAGAYEAGQAPDRIPVRRHCPRCAQPHGRPTLDGLDVRLSVSHSGELVAVATCTTADVGVDVEQLQDFDYAPLLRRVLAPAETDGVRTRADFYVCWTRKESVLKATGDGLRTSMSQVVLTPPDAPPRLLHYGGRADLRAAMVDLSMAVTASAGGYAAALTALAPGPLIVDERDAADLLDR